MKILQNPPHFLLSTAIHHPSSNSLKRSLCWQVLLLVVAAVIFSGCTSSSQDLDSAQADRPPNIVFIFADDLGYGDLGCYGATDIKTPHIDQLAQQGIRFTDFYSVSPVCTPSRYGLLTGRYPVRDGVHRGVFFPESWTGMDTAEITLAQVLQQRGYATGIIGKWHLGHHRQYLPLQRGFDYYFGIPYSNDMEAVVYLRGNEVVDEAVDQRQNVKTYTQEALQFIEAHQEEPFFLYLPHAMPHVPIYASEEFQGTSQRGLYGDVIQEMDWSVGQIVSKLQALGLEENTMLVFTSDNGPWRTMIELGGSPGKLRAGKQTTFEGGMRVPCLVQWKAGIKPGQVIEGMHNMMDWFPTLAHLAGGQLPTDRPIDGEDISAVLQQGGKRKGQQLAYYSIYTGDLAAFRSGDWKLKLPMERPYGGRYGFEGEEAHGMLLFNLKEDPGEQQNLAEKHPEKVAQLQKEIEAFKASLGVLPPPKKMKEPADRSHEEYLKKKYGSS